MVLFLLPILVVRRLVAKKNESHSVSFASKIDNAEIYFIGSSRTRRAINDSMLNARFKNNNFVNIGMDNCTFLFNKVIADKLLDAGNVKTLFIELSVINSRLPAIYSQVATDKDIFGTIVPLINQGGINDFRKIFWPILEQVSLSKARLGPAIRKFLPEQTVDGKLGFAGAYDTTKTISEHYLTEADLVKGYGKKIHPLYLQLVTELIAKAKLTGANIVFFISPAIKTEAEKEVLLSMYNLVPPEHRLVYEQSFLNKIHQRGFFMDETHFNTQGSFLFTEYLQLMATRHNWIR